MWIETIKHDKKVWKLNDMDPDNHFKWIKALRTNMANVQPAISGKWHVKRMMMIEYFIESGNIMIKFPDHLFQFAFLKDFYLKKTKQSFWDIIKVTPLCIQRNTYICLLCYFLFTPIIWMQHLDTYRFKKISMSKNNEFLNKSKS